MHAFNLKRWVSCRYFGRQRRWRLQYWSWSGWATIEFIFLFYRFCYFKYNFQYFMYFSYSFEVEPFLLMNLHVLVHFCLWIYSCHAHCIIFLRIMIFTIDCIFVFVCIINKLSSTNKIEPANLLFLTFKVLGQTFVSIN